MKTLTLGVLAAVALAASGMSAKANLVTNGNFATGDFTGWTNPAGSGVAIDATFPAPGDTNDAVFTGSGTLSQSVPTTTGGSYMLYFSVVDEAPIPTDTFTVSFGTFTATITGDTTGGVYTAESFTVPAADVIGTSTELSFQGFSQIAVWNLDDVSVVPVSTAVPEPASGALIASGLLLMTMRRRKSTSRSA
jgi:hypothetical protein